MLTRGAKTPLRKKQEIASVTAMPPPTIPSTLIGMATPEEAAAAMGLVTQKVTRREKVQTLHEIWEEQQKLPKLEIYEVLVSLLSVEDILATTDIEITNAEDSGPGSVNDPRAGVPGAMVRCTTCRTVDCGGHSLRHTLARKVYHPIHIRDNNTIVMVLSCTCYYCGRLMLTKADVEAANVVGLPRDKRLRALSDYAIAMNVPHRVRNEELQNMCGVQPSCPQNLRYDFSRSKQTTSVRYRYPKGQDDGIERILDIDAPEGYARTTVWNLLNGLRPDEAALLGFTDSHPRDLILQMLLVPPPQMRPAMPTQNGLREDPLTALYKQIAKISGYIRRARTIDEADKHAADLYSKIETLMINPDNNPINDQPFVPITKRLTGKGAVWRRVMQGKRGGYCGRTVLGIAPNLKFGEVRIPEKFKNLLTVPVKVTQYNRPYVEQLIKDRQVAYVIPYDNPTEYREITGETRIYLNVGDTVERYQRFGDYVNFNRQPSLHRYSLMSFKAVPGNTLTTGLHPSSLNPLGADNDGDEGNENEPQSDAARMESKVLMSAPRCIISDQQGRPLQFFIMDTVTSFHLMTRPGVVLEDQEFTNCLMQMTYTDDLPSLPHRLKRWNINPLSGRALFSALLPPDFVYPPPHVKSDVVIRDGVLISGTLDSNDLGGGHRSLVQEIVHIYGNQRTAHFLTDGTFVGNYYITEIRGYSVGGVDCLPPETFARELPDFILGTLGGLIGSLTETIADKAILKLRDEDIASLYDYTEEQKLKLMREVHAERQRNQDISDILLILRRIPEVYGMSDEQREYEVDKTIDGAMLMVRDYVIRQNNEHLQERIESLPQVRTIIRNIITYHYIERPTARSELRKRYLDALTSKIESYGGRLATTIEENYRETQIVSEIRGFKNIGADVAKLEREMRMADSIPGMLEIVETVDDINSENAVLHMLSDFGSGAKGNKLTWDQIAVALGQLYLRSKRLQPELTGGTRCMPSAPFGEGGTENPKYRGLVTSSYTEGLSPEEVMSMLITSRESLVDITEKTPKAGKLSRYLSFAMSPMVVNYDGTVRLINGKYIQMFYGAIGYDTTEMVRVGSDNMSALAAPFDLKLLIERENSKCGWISTKVAKAASEGAFLHKKQRAIIDLQEKLTLVSSDEEEKLVMDYIRAISSYDKDIELLETLEKERAIADAQLQGMDPFSAIYLVTYAQLKEAEEKIEQVRRRQDIATKILEGVTIQLDSEKPKGTFDSSREEGYALTEVEFHGIHSGKVRNLIPKSQRTHSNRVSLIEYDKIVNLRMDMLREGVAPLIDIKHCGIQPAMQGDIEVGCTTVEQIAREEVRRKLIPFILYRPRADDLWEEWDFSELVMFDKTQPEVEFEWGEEKRARLLVANDQRKTRPRMTPYEYIMIVAKRAEMLADGDRPLVEIDSYEHLDIAEAEVRAGVAPIVIYRPSATGESEPWHAYELALPYNLVD